jgi:hypothetical protein
VIRKTTQDVVVRTETVNPSVYAIRKKDEIRAVLPPRGAHLGLPGPPKGSAT